MLFFKKKKRGPQYLYTERELEGIEGYITEHFGPFSQVYHELASPDVHLDICIVEPTADRPYYTLITMGAGAYRMKVPTEYKQYNIDCAEYVICLPATWNLQSGEDRDYWPIKALKDMARLPIWYDTWLAFGHSTQKDEAGAPYADNTRINSFALDDAVADDNSIKLRSGRVVNFWKMIPLYPEELSYLMERRAQDLFAVMKEKGTYPEALDIDRPNTFAD